MPKIVWDEQGKRRYETGVSHAVLYVKDTSTAPKYTTGVPWNGLTGMTDSPSGAEETPLYANNVKYLSLYSAENFGGTIKAYTYPDAWSICDGSCKPERAEDQSYTYDFPGVRVGQQPRRGFGLTYRTVIGNDSKYDQYGFNLHIIWNAMASPSSKDYQTINDSPEAIELSWDYTTVPVAFTKQEFVNYKPTSVIVIDSTKADPTRLNKLMNILYGTDGTTNSKATLPTPDEVLTIMQVRTAKNG